MKRVALEYFEQMTGDSPSRQLTLGRCRAVGERLGIVGTGWTK